jgi:hypothetical protein
MWRLLRLFSLPGCALDEDAEEIQTQEWVYASVPPLHDEGDVHIDLEAQIKCAKKRIAAVGVATDQPHVVIQNLESIRDTLGSQAPAASRADGPAEEHSPTSCVKSGEVTEGEREDADLMTGDQTDP